MAGDIAIPTNVTTVNFNIYPQSSVRVSNTGDEYVSTITLNKAFTKALINYATLISYFNYKFTGTFIPGNLIISADIKPLSTPQKNALNAIIDDNFFVGVNEKTAPQVLNRMFTSLLAANSAILAQTNVEISNLDQAMRVVTTI